MPDRTKKYMCPWQKHPSFCCGNVSEAYIRPYFGLGGGWIVWCEKDGWHRVHVVKKIFNSKEAAMADTDQDLINQGYVLLSEEQLNRLQVLL
jgi:hypothetical protein